MTSDLVALFRKKADAAWLLSEKMPGESREWLKLVAEAQTWTHAADNAADAQAELEQADARRLAHFRTLAEDHIDEIEPYTLDRALEVLLTRHKAGEGLPEDMLVMNAINEAMGNLRKALELIRGV